MFAGCFQSKSSSSYFNLSSISDETLIEISKAHISSSNDIRGKIDDLPFDDSKTIIKRNPKRNYTVIFSYGSLSYDTLIRVFMEISPQGKVTNSAVDFHGYF